MPFARHRPPSPPFHHNDIGILGLSSWRPFLIIVNTWKRQVTFARILDDITFDSDIKATSARVVEPSINSTA